MTRLLRHKLAAVGGMLSLLMLLGALAAPLLAPYDPLVVRMDSRLQPPGVTHLLGTDDFGRDILSRTLYGARISLRVGFLTVLLTLAAGGVLGLIAGYSPRLDAWLMRIMDGLMSFPAILLALAIVAVLGPQEINAVLAMAVVYTPATARVVRSAVLNLRGQEFVEAAQALGGSDRHVLLRHVLPNCAAPILVQATFTFAYAILAEASLSFLGAGTPPPSPSWGTMLAEARVYIREAPWTSLYPGIAISLTVLGLNLLGDGLRDLLDPRLR